MPRDRIVPLIVACALFMENMDSTVIATSLPAIAADIGTSALALRLAIGPPLGGFVTTSISWHWIFLINTPIGLMGIVLATIFIEDVRAESPDPFDPLGMVLAGLGIGGLAFGGSVLGLNFLPTGVVVALIAVGATATFAYVLHARRTPAPVLDLSLLKIPTLRAAVLGGFIYRSGIGALP